MFINPLIIEAAMNMMEVKPPPRPYTEYNIFFQIERGEMSLCCQNVIRVSSSITDLTLNLLIRLFESRVHAPKPWCDTNFEGRR